MEENHYCNNCQRQISIANFATHSAFCERFIKVCKLCNEPIQTSEEQQHLEEFHIAVPCDLCGISVEKWALPKHQESCTKRPVTCNFCEGEFPFEEFPEHFEFCSSRTEKCVLCQKYVMLKDKEKHSEIHLCERKIRHANIDKEIKQNIINEAISNITSPEQDIQEKVTPTRFHSSEISVVNESETYHPQSSVLNERSTSVPNKSKEVDEGRSSSISGGDIMADKDGTHLKIRVPAGASACASDIPKEMSKHYTTCYICKQIIPWIDMNTHIPSCASDAGKCSRCGEDVPNHEFKEHILKRCKTLLPGGSSNKTDLKRDKISRDGPLCMTEMDIDDEDMKQCPHCKQLCSLDRISEHIKSCSETRYECPYCCVAVAEKDKGRHEAFECGVLLEIQGHGSFPYMHSSSHATRNSPEKYKYTSDINMTAKSRIARDKSSVDKSYADASRKSSLQDEKNSSKCKSCCPCHEKSPCKKGEQSYTSQKSRKGSCFYCFEEIDAVKEDLHLSTCKAFRESNRLDHEHQTSYKGAIPKRTNFADMVKPQTIKCKFCKTTFNADIVLYHEKECVHQPFTCDECDDSFPLKDLEDHRCKLRRKDKGKQEEVQKKTDSGSGRNRIWSFFSKSESNDGYDSNRFHSTYSLDDANVKIPCEFCEKLFAASDIVEHETGCAPDLVSLPRKDSPQERFFPSETKPDLLYCRSGGVKKCIESNVAPGEFLKSNKTSETSKDQKMGSVGCSSIHSVWNISSSDAQVEAEDLKISPHSSSLDKGKESETSYDVQKTFEDKEIFNSDDEMSEMLEFINEGKTNATDKEAFQAKCEELHRKYSRESTSDITYRHNLNSQRHHEDVSENKKFLQHTELTSSIDDIDRQIMELVKGDENHGDTFDVKRLKHHHLPNIASENRAFTIEPAENICLEHMSVEENGEVVDDSVGDNQDTKMQHTSQESYSETSSEDDLEKWAKWHSSGKN